MGRLRSSLKRSREEAFAFFRIAAGAYMATTERAVNARKVIAGNIADLVVAACDVLDLTLAETGAQALERLAGHHADTSDNPAHDWAVACRERIGDCEKWCNDLDAENTELGEELALSELAQLNFTFEVSFPPGSGAGLQVVPCEGSVFDAPLHATPFALYMFFRTKGDIPCEGPYFMALATFFKDSGGLPWLNTRACEDLTNASLDLADELAGSSSELYGSPGFRGWLLELVCHDPTEATLVVVLERLSKQGGSPRKRTQLAQVVHGWCLAADPAVALRHVVVLMEHSRLNPQEWESLGLHLCRGVALKSTGPGNLHTLRVLFELATELRNKSRPDMLSLFNERFLCPHGRVATLLQKFPAVRDLDALTGLADELASIQDGDRWTEWDLLPSLVAKGLRTMLRNMAQTRPLLRPWASSIAAMAKLLPQEPRLCLMVRTLRRTFRGNMAWCRTLMQAFLRAEAGVGTPHGRHFAAAGMAYLARADTSAVDVLKLVGLKPNRASVALWMEGCLLGAMWRVECGDPDSIAGELRWQLNQAVALVEETGVQATGGMEPLRKYLQSLRATRAPEDPVRRMLDAEGDGGLAESTRRALLE